MSKYLKFIEDLERQNQTTKILLNIALIGGVGFLELLTGKELNVAAFYAIPILLITWLLGREWGIIASIISVFVNLAVLQAVGYSDLNPLIIIVNTLIRFSVFILVVWILSALKNAIIQEQKLSRTDYLTGAANSRFFFELLQMEMDRLQRYQQPFTLAYIDLDNFKTVNDQFGHSTGDQVLHSVVSYAKKHLRKVDVVARIGGDEFVFLLPETNQEDARAAIEKLQHGLLEEMQKNDWPITFSMGVLTCYTAPLETNKLITIVDDLMYLVKNSSKNAIRYSSYSD